MAQGATSPGVWHGGCMRCSVRLVHEPVAALVPVDDLEAQHQAGALGWLETTDDVYRRVKPATPERHLVSYVVVVDPDDGSSLLVDHISAGRWLPPGGHVEPDEHPADTARRETREELGIEAVFVERAASPAFVSITRTVGQDSGHDDVSLWFLLRGRRDMTLDVDPTEFHGSRWWTPAEVRTEPRGRFDPHYRRFIEKASR